MKKLYFFILLFCATSIYAQTFKSGDLYFSVQTGGNVTVAKDASYKSLTEVTIPESVVYQGVTYPVTAIAYQAFYECKSLISVTIPNSVTTIGDYAFSSCSSLTSVTIPNSVTTIGGCVFEYCSSLTSVTIPNSVTTIGGNVFYRCTSLTFVTIPNNNFTFNSTMFYKCDALTSITIVANSLQEFVERNINQQLCNGSYTRNAARHIVINGTELIHNVTIPDGTTTINAQTFYNCTSINSVVLPTTVTTIGEEAFWGVKYLHMQSSTPPTITNKNVVNSNTVIVLPDAATLATYQSASVWSELATQMVTKDALQVREVTISQNQAMSALHVALGEENLMNTTSLKVHGTINSYDIMLMRNKMLNLKYLDLSEAEVKACPYEYYTGYCSHDSVLENYAFSELKLRVVHLPKNLTEIHDCFAACPYLDTVYCQPGLKIIGPNTFSGSTSLRHVEMHEGITQIGSSAFNYTTNLRTITLPNSLEEIGNYAFQTSGLQSIYIPENVASIGQYAFSSGQLQHVTFAPNGKLQLIETNTFKEQSVLQTIDWENTNIITIESYAFASCKSLKLGQMPKKLKTINQYAFRYCSAIDTISLPPRLETIQGYAFQDCINTKVIKISSSVRNIQNYAFTGCANVERVYTYTVEPTNILQQTFSCWHVANLYVPATSYYNYYYNTQWSQFIKLIEFDEEYDYFYLNGDYTLGGDNGVIEGNPDVDLNPGSGITIVGDETVELGDIDYTGGEEYPTIISNNNLNIDTLSIFLPQEKGKWHFLTFPYDIKREDIHCNSEFVVRYYDGQIRADKGSGGWQNVPVGEKMLNGQGYIFQSAKKDTLVLVFPEPQLPNKDISIPLYLYNAVNVWDANWNMIGNPYLAYYDMDSIKGFTYPVVTWNGKGYDTYRPGDDNYHFKPLEGFFIQNVSLSNITLPLSGRETQEQASQKMSAAPARRLVAERKENATRFLVDITLSDSTYTDRTRVVFNDQASLEYEMGVDASKMISTTAPVQLYTIGDDNEQYSINERPATANGEVIQLGYYAAYTGDFVLSVSRMDTTIMLYDNVEKCYVDLSKGDYTFSTEQGFNNQRFAMYAIESEKTPTSIQDINIDDLGNVSVYTITGQVIAENVDFTTLQLPAGTYMIKTKNAIYKTILP